MEFFFFNFRTPYPITKIKELEDFSRKEQFRKLSRKVDISNPKIMQDLYLNGDDIILPCHSERSEESHKSLLPQSLRFFTSFRMTDISKDFIGIRREKSK